ncbi:hypothetical protein GCM10009841_29660 [Microlunatus panaciterrae]
MRRPYRYAPLVWVPTPRGTWHRQRMADRAKGLNMNRGIIGTIIGVLVIIILVIVILQLT